MRGSHQVREVRPSSGRVKAVFATAWPPGLSDLPRFGFGLENSQLVKGGCSCFRKVLFGLFWFGLDRRSSRFCKRYLALVHRLVKCPLHRMQKACYLQWNLKPQELILRLSSEKYTVFSLHMGRFKNIDPFTVWFVHFISKTYFLA